MLLILQVLLLVVVIKMLLESENALLCAAAYAAPTAVLGLLFGQNVLAVLIGAVITMVYCYGWFWLLVRLVDGLGWWLVLIAGLLAPFALRIALDSIAAE